MHEHVKMQPFRLSMDIIPPSASPVNHAAEHNFQITRAYHRFAHFAPQRNGVPHPPWGAAASAPPYR